jgi:hypothetical protein
LPRLSEMHDHALIISFLYDVTTNIKTTGNILSRHVPRMFVFSNILFNTLVLKSPGSAVHIATGYGLEDQRVGVRVPIGSRMFTSSYRPDRPIQPRIQ